MNFQKKNLPKIIIQKKKLQKKIKEQKIKLQKIKITEEYQKTKVENPKIRIQKDKKCQKKKHKIKTAGNFTGCFLFKNINICRFSSFKRWKIGI